MSITALGVCEVTVRALFVRWLTLCLLIILDLILTAEIEVQMLRYCLCFRYLDAICNTAINMLDSFSHGHPVASNILIVTLTFCKKMPETKFNTADFLYRPVYIRHQRPSCIRFCVVSRIIEAGV